jgi:hypothetical protein
MATLREYFDSEAAVYLDGLQALAAADAGVDLAALTRLSRGLRGTAQIAREEHVFRAAAALESAASSLAGQPIEWTAAARTHLLDAVAALRDLAGPIDLDSGRDERIEMVLAACRSLAPAPGPAAAAAADEDSLHARFRDYVAAEADAIARVIDDSIDAFRADPMNRDALRAVLRRHRALLGAARLDEIRVVAETVRAVEDIAGIIGKLDAPIKREWLDVFRCARDVLRSAAASLRAGEDPRPTTALSRLRTLHEELLDRYGALEAAAPSPAARSSETTATEGGAPTATRPDHAGPAALRRAIELRPRLERAIGENAAAREIVDELFDLIRLGLE